MEKVGRRGKVFKNSIICVYYDNNDNFSFIPFTLFDFSLIYYFNLFYKHKEKKKFIIIRMKWIHD